MTIASWESEIAQPWQITVGKTNGSIGAIAALLPSSTMTYYQQILGISTHGKSLCKVTAKVQSVVAESGIYTGLCTLFLRHTSASLLIQENADPDVLTDLNSFFAKLVPEGDRYIHSTEGPDDMPAHIRTALTSTSEHIPIVNGRLGLGIWQGIYIWEHRQHGSTRELIVQIMGEPR